MLAKPLILPLYQGDTWQPTIALTNEDGTVFNASTYTLSGICHVGDVATPVSPGQATNLTLGFLQLVVPPSITATAPESPDEQPFYAEFPTRIQYILTDTTGAAETYAVVRIKVRVA